MKAHGNNSAMKFREKTRHLCAKLNLDPIKFKLGKILRKADIYDKSADSKDIFGQFIQKAVIF